MEEINRTQPHGLLAGKKGIITGVVDEMSIAWSVAQRCMAEGAKIVLTNSALAIRLGSVSRLAEEAGVELIAADATNEEELRNLMEESEKILGGKIDFVLHSVAMSQNIRRHMDYDVMNYNYFNTTIDVSAVSLHRMLRCGMESETLAEGCSVVALTFIASDRYMANYNDMSDAKALLESVARNMGGVCGVKKGIRVNCISQSAVESRAGKSFGQMEFFREYTENMAPLGNASKEDCAELCAMLFSDYTRKVTMQTIFNDGGFSRTVMTEKFMNHFGKF
ncbi:MAG: SDR family oxidoreductase [Paludibacteraceae bacterium]|nr:SDR family oxidoreductase [Paludibacteraceae bacterium]